MALRYFLACGIVLSSLVPSPCVVSAKPPTYVLLGQEVHLRPVFTGHPDDILWKQDGNKVVEFNGQEEHVYSRYQSRVTLDWVSAELYIKDLSHEDSGEYELEIYMNKEMHRFAYNLEVIDKVNKPSISCDMNSSSSDTSGTWATLTCFAEPTRPLSSLKNEYVYEWESSGNVMTGHQLTILLEEEPDDQMYTCKVSNPLTSETTTFAATTCYPDTSSSVALIVSLTIISILICVVLLAVVFCKLKNKACFAKSNSANVENGRSSTQERDPDDEKTHFLHKAPTLPSHQRLRPLVPDPTDHREHAAADLDKGEESNKKEDEIIYSPEITFGVKLKPRLKRALPDPDHQVEESNKEKDEIEHTPIKRFGVSLKPNLKRALPDPDHQEEGKRRHESEFEGQLESRAAEEEDIQGKTEEDQSPTSPEQNMPETAPGEHHSKLSEGETRAKEDDQPEMDKTVSGDKRESDGEETEILSEDTSQSPTPKNTDNTQTNTFEKSPNAALPDPDPRVESESKQKSESEGQSDSSAAEEEDDEGKTEEDRPPTSHEQNTPEMASGEHHSKLSEGETHAKEDDQEEMDKTVSGDKRGSDRKETEENLNTDTSQSTTQKNTFGVTLKPTCLKSALPDPDHQGEDESKHESEFERQIDSSAAEEEDGEEKTEEDQSPTSPEQHMPETAPGEHHSKLSEEETQAKEEDQPEMDKTVSGDKHESDGEETEANLYSDTSQSPTPKNTDNTQTSTFEKSPNAALPDPDPRVESESKYESESEGQSDSSAAEEEDNKGKTEEDQSPTSPEQKMREPASGELHSKLSEGETQTKEDDLPEMDKTVSGDKHESDGEETEENLYSDTSQSPTPKNTDNTQTSTFEKSPNTALPDPDHQVEGESKHESESERQSDSSTAEEEDDEEKTEEKTKDEFDPKEEKPANMSESEDKEGEKKTGAVEK